MKEENKIELSKKLGHHVESRIYKFFDMEPNEQLESLRDDLANMLEPSNPLILLVKKVTKDLSDELNKSEDKKERWDRVEERLWEKFDYHFQLTIRHFIRYSLLFSLLSDEHSIVFPKEYLNESKKEFGLETSGKFQKALIKTLDRCFFDEVKRGGKKATIGDREKLQLLALYNRYSVVIKNARKERKAIKKSDKNKREKQIREDLALKYEIPEIHIDSLFSVDTVSDTALSWAKQTLKLELNDDYLKDKLTEARKTWKGRGLIIDAYGRRRRMIFAVNPKDEIKKGKLRFTPVPKDFNDIFRNEFLVEFGV